MKDDCVYLQHILDEIEYLESLRPFLSYTDLTQDKITEHAVTGKKFPCVHERKNCRKVNRRYFPVRESRTIGVQEKFLQNNPALRIDTGKIPAGMKRLWRSG